MKKKLTVKKSLVIKIVAVVAAVCTAASVVFYIADRKRDFNSASKSTVAMNTVMTQKIYGELPGKQISDIIELTKVIEKLFSFKDEDSYLYALNQSGEINNPYIAEALEVCLEVSEKTEGAFDVTLGDISLLWGIGTENEGIPDEDEIASALESCGYEKIKVDGTTVSFDGDFSVDMGAAGKGIACDYIMNYLKSAEDVEGGVVSVGGSIVVYGRHNKAGDKWRVAVRHPRSENEFLGVINLDEGFVSTSGDYEKYFEQDAERYHHIFDGNTGYPADSGLISVTVVCDSGILSDVLSTACFILGEEKGRELLEYYGAAGIFVSEDMEITLVGDIDFEY